VALSGADPQKNVPITIWMHRGCVPFVSHTHFNEIYWPTLKPIVLEIWRRGHQTLFYAEGKWGAHLDAFAELPDASIIYHVDQDDLFEVHRKIGHKFAISGGIPNTLLSFGKPEEIRAYCKKVIDGVARDGGYIMDASAIMQNDMSVENMRAWTAFTREYGQY
jgi:uroporphyrinogen-III decarboxylase